jgi:hypothetical protein
MKNRFHGERSERRTSYDRFSQDRRFIEGRGSQAVHYSIDEVVGVRPKTEIGFGDKNKLYSIAREYEEKNNSGSPFIMLLFFEGNDLGFSKIYFSEYHEDINNKSFIKYVNGVKETLLDYMKQRNPSKTIKGAVSVHGSDDNIILGMLRKYVRAEELIKYKIKIS